MLFNSIPYLIFLPIVFFLSWFLFSRSNLFIQNLFLLVVSYVFYSWWDWRFLFLLMTSTLIDYYFGLWIYRRPDDRGKKIFLWLSVFNNLGLLCFFKYYNFFVDSAAELMASLGMGEHHFALNIVLPVGISFYTFHGMSYVFDIYNGKVKPTTNFVNYSLFVSYFPLLVAGPIERAHHLLPQLEVQRKFSYQQSIQGLRLMLWGFFKKVVIADTLAKSVNEIFAHTDTSSGATLAFGAILFGFQIYCDFSGYTDIALGTSKLFGIELLTNFRFPYFSRNIAEFWRRWHISLSSWFRDYLYIPLGGSRVSVPKAIRNTFIIFIVSGFWHGANWTYLFWGFLHGLFFIPSLLLKTNKKHANTVVAQNSAVPSITELGQMLFTFLLVTFAWIFFRAPTITDAFSYIRHIPHRFFEVPKYLELLPYVIVLLVGDWLQRRDERNVLQISNKILRYIVYFILAILIILHFQFIDISEFIYFKF